jgi:hypothetical protein
MKLFFWDRELIFTCSNAFNDQVERKNDEAKIDIGARKRTLKRNMKKRSMQSVADDSSRMK